MVQGTWLLNSSLDYAFYYIITIFLLYIRPTFIYEYKHLYLRQLMIPSHIVLGISLILDFQDIFLSCILPALLFTAFCLSVCLTLQGIPKRIWYCTALITTHWSSVIIWIDNFLDFHTNIQWYSFTSCMRGSSFSSPNV